MANDAEEGLKAAKGAIEVVGEIMKAAGDNPDVKEAASNLGKTALTLTKTINTVLLPLAAVNFAVDKAKAYFSGTFQKDLGEKASAIPPESIVEPKASIAGPALQGLAFAHEEPNLKDMYLNLLKTAMDGRVAGNAHPAFVEVIRQLTADEARLLGNILTARAVSTVEIRLTADDNKGFTVLQSHLLNVTKAPSGEPADSSKLAAMVDNWVRLGLVRVSYAENFTAESQYAWVAARPEVIAYREMYGLQNREVQVQRGVLSATAFGLQFGGAVGV